MMRGQDMQRQATLAPGVNRQGLVLGLGVALIVANLWSDPAWRALFGAATDPKAALGQARSRTSALDVGLELALVLFLVFLAGFGDMPGTIAVVLIAGLWLVFLVRNADSVTSAIAALGKGSG